MPTERALKYLANNSFVNARKERDPNYQKQAKLRSAESMRSQQFEITCECGKKMKKHEHAAHLKDYIHQVRLNKKLKKGKK